MSPFRLVMVAGLLLLGAMLPLAAQDMAGWGSLYTEGKTALASGNVSVASDRFEKIITNYPGSSVITVCYFLAATSRLQQGQNARVHQLTVEFRQRFPRSVLLPYLSYLDGEAYLAEKSWLPACEAYWSVLRSSSDAKLRQNAATGLTRLLKGWVDPIEVRRALELHGTDTLSDKLAFDFGKAAFDRKDWGGVQSWLGNFDRLYPGSGMKSDAGRLAEQARQQVLSSLPIGVVLSLTGPSAEFGQAVLNGLQLAAEEYRAASGKTLDLRVEDDHSDPVLAVQLAQYLVQDGVWMLIGPLRSEPAIGFAVVAEQAGIPLILPTANLNGLSGLGKNIIQLNSPLDVQSQLLADYVVDFAGIREIAIIAPGDYETQRQVVCFADRCRELGASIVFQRAFPAGSTDIDSLLEALKAPKLAALKPEFQKADTTDLRFYKKDGTPKDSTQWPVTYQAMYMPMSEMAALQLIPQVPYNYITTRLIGTSTWNVEEQPDDVKYYLNEGIFLADNFWVSTHDTAWSSFEGRYRRKYGTTPSRIDALGYDSGRLLGKALTLGGITSAAGLRDRLFEVKPYVGPSGTVALDETGVNRAATILTFRNGQLEKLR